MKRNKEFKIRMSVEELESLDLKVRLCKCSREKFVRETLFKAVPNIPPPIEYQRLINEMNAIGRNLNQLVKLCYVQKISQADVEKVLTEFQMVVHNINDAIHRGSS